jgi:hypothetical protein
MNDIFETSEALPLEWIESVKTEAKRGKMTLDAQTVGIVTTFSGCKSGIDLAKRKIVETQPKSDPSWGLRHIRQRGKTDCGLAVSAMLAGVGYSDAADADPHPDADGGMSIADFSVCLETLGFSCKVKRASIRLAHASLPANAALLIRRHSKVFGHWIATDGRLIFDPEDEAPVALREYRRADWSLIRIVERR